jgi:hypothetical protein
MIIILNGFHLWIIHSRHALCIMLSEDINFYFSIYPIDKIGKWRSIELEISVHICVEIPLFCRSRTMSLSSDQCFFYDNNNDMVLQSNNERLIVIPVRYVM